MNVRELVFRGDDATRLYACGECGSVHSPTIYLAREAERHAAARRAAEECCAPRVCACGAAIEKQWTACAPCRERNRLKRAKVVAATDHDGAVYSEDTEGEWGGGYSSDVPSLCDAAGEKGGDAPAYCHPCTATPLHLDADAILESALDGMHEDAADQVEAYDELVSFIEGWNARQTCVSYHPDMGRVIVLHPARFEALIREQQPRDEAANA